MNRFILSVAAVFFAFGVCAAEMPSIFMAGDSTMCDRKPTDKKAGWGQSLKKLVKDGVVVNNLARGGFSSKSFIDKGNWDKMIAKVRKGDYVIIQFGHNDQKPKDVKRYSEVNTTYKDNLRKYISDVRAKEAKVVLATSISRRAFDKKGKFVDQAKLRKYAEAMIAVGQECKVPVVDLNTLTKELIVSMGEEKSAELFLYYHDKKDNTHTIAKGADAIADFFVQDAKKQGLEIARLFK